MPKLVQFKVTKCDLKQTNQIQRKILVSRGLRDARLRSGKTLRSTTKQLNQQLKRNVNRFPRDFAFQLTLEEAKNVAALRPQNATLKRGHHIKHPPHVFTEHGAITRSGSRKPIAFPDPRILAIYH